MATLAEPLREWDPDRPVLAGLLARREELLSSHVEMRDGQARFITPSTSASQWWDPPAPQRPTGPAQGALAAVAALPKQVVEEFDLDALVAEQVTDAEQVMAALRDEPLVFEMPVRTRAQPLVRMEMPKDGIDVWLSVHVSCQPLRATLLMPMTGEPGERGTRIGWATGHIPKQSRPLSTPANRRTGR